MAENDCVDELVTEARLLAAKADNTLTELKDHPVPTDEQILSVLATYERLKYEAMVKAFLAYGFDEDRCREYLLEQGIFKSLPPRLAPAVC